jgi:hypothetical protein
MLSFNAGKVTYMYTYIPKTMTDVTRTNDTAVNHNHTSNRVNITISHKHLKSE